LEILLDKGLKDLIYNYMGYDKDFFEKEIYTNSNRLKENFIVNNYYDFYLFIIENYKGESFLQRLYNFYKGDHKCYCGNNTKFIDFKKGYLKFCSINCSRNSEETKEKYKKTCLDKYGVDNVSKLADIKKIKEEKSYEKYGVSTPLQSNYVKEKIIAKYGVDNPFKLKNIQDKIKNTNLEKYGFICSLQDDNIKEKSKKTNLEKYGVDHFSMTDIWKKNIKLINDEKYLKSLSLPNNYQFISKDGNTNKIRHIDCDNVFEIQTQLIRIRKNNKSEICKCCNKINHNLENTLLSYIQSIYKSETIKYRDKKYEIDIYLPELKLGFEFNGLYWHSELFKDKDYHKNKMLYFKEKGIRILNIWEDDWIYREDIIKSIIRLNLNIDINRVYARNCKISKVSERECKDFLNKNHIQGWCVSKYRYALIYNDEIISILTIGKRRLNLGYKNNKKELEILRFCNKINTSVIGGFSKLFKSIKKDIEFDRIITYSDLSIFTGDIYLKTGFKFIGITEPGYYYNIKGIRKNRFNFNKSKLIKMGFDTNKTEREIMFENKHYRVYDCGNSKFEFMF
jgi:hypothetical protein